MLLEERGKLVAVVDAGPVGHRQAEFGEAFAHEELVLSDREGIRAGVDLHARVDERPEDVLRHVLVVEGDDVDGLRECEDRVGVAIVADLHCRELRGHALLLGEDPDVEPQVHRGRHHHPGELTSTDHSDANAHGFTPALRQRAGGFS